MSLTTKERKTLKLQLAQWRLMNRECVRCRMS